MRTNSSSRRLINVFNEKHGKERNGTVRYYSINASFTCGTRSRKFLKEAFSRTFCFISPRRNVANAHRPPYTAMSSGATTPSKLEPSSGETSTNLRAAWEKKEKDRHQVSADPTEGDISKGGGGIVLGNQAINKNK